MHKLPDSIVISLILPFVGNVAPELESFEFVSKSFAAWAKRAYCAFCGVVTSARTVPDGKGRVVHAHTDECNWPEKLDPWREFYQMVDWKTCFAAGGWPAFLHYKLYRRFPCSWKEGGLVSKRDLDVFLYDHTTIDQWISFYFGEECGVAQEAKEAKMGRKMTEKETTWFNRIQWEDFKSRYIKRPSQWNDKIRRHETPRNAGCKFRLPSGPAVDVVGESRSIHNPHHILERFDLSRPRVGFKGAANKRTWILHPTHTHAMELKLLPQGEDLEFHPEITDKEKKEIEVSQFNSNQNRRKRFDKYVRLYGRECTCDCKQTGQQLLVPAKRLKLTTNEDSYLLD